MIIQKKISKPALSLENQYLELKRRKIIIDDSDKKILEKISLQRILYYYKKLNIKSLSFKNLYTIYLFDAQLREIFIGILNHIEITLRTQLINIHCVEYGIYGYLSHNNFERKDFHEMFLNDLNKNISKNRDKHLLKDHNKRYSDDFPFYKIIEIISFGELSKFYKNLHKEDKKKIALFYHPKVNRLMLDSWFQSLVSIRNDCAHNEFFFIKKIKFPLSIGEMNEWKTYDSQSLWLSILVIKTILKETQEWEIFKLKFIKLIESNNSNIYLIIQKNMVLPINWKEKLDE